MIQKNTVLIANRVTNHKDINIFNKDLEMLSDEYFNAVYKALSEISPKCTHYKSPKEFLDNINLHTDDVVLSLWSGYDSRNRRALVPSICEAHNIAYVGADAYINLISSDKELTKEVCLKHNIPSAKGILVHSEYDTMLLSTLSYPSIIKPNYEGGSIGIFQRNLVSNATEAKKICLELLPVFSPLLVEEYIPGYEVCVCISGNKNIDIFEIIQTKIGNIEYFENEILSAEYKKINSNLNKKVIANHLLDTTEKNKIKHLYTSLGRAMVMRIDGRIRNGKFHLIELTPDCSLRRDGAMSIAFQSNGFAYNQMIENLCQMAIQEWEFQNANN